MVMSIPPIPTLLQEIKQTIEIIEKNWKLWKKWRHSFYHQVGPAAASATDLWILKV